MTHNYTKSKNLDRILHKLFKKNKSLYEDLLNKMNEVINTQDIDHYKNLRYDLKQYKRVHVGNFVLVFRFDKNKDLILFEEFDHHDKIYAWRPKIE